VALAAQPGFAITAGEPFPGRYEPSDVLVQALRDEAPMRATLAKLAPVEIDADPALVRSLNTPGELKEGLTLFKVGGDRPRVSRSSTCRW
jgi:hypothetical protein